MKHFLATLALAAVSCPAGAEEITVHSLGYLPAADVWLLGEHHDNPMHHLNQTILMDVLGARAVVFEMLEPDQGLAITPELRDSAPLLGAMLQWDTRGWPDFGMYYPLFTVGGGLPVFGGAVPSEEVRAAIVDGAAASFGIGAAVFGLDVPLPEAEQEAREAEQDAAHCNAMPPEMLGGMVEAQRLRDAGLAQAVLAALAETGGPVAVILGNGHARRDWGVPALLAVAAPDVSVVSIGQLEAAPEIGPEGAPPYDYWFVTDGVDRGDPCEAFQR